MRCQRKNVLFHTVLKTYDSFALKKGNANFGKNDHVLTVSQWKIFPIVNKKSINSKADSKCVLVVK